VQGLPVFGSRRNLKEIIEKNEIDDILISTKSIPENEIAELLRFCEEANVGLYNAHVIIEPVGEGRFS